MSFGYSALGGQEWLRTRKPHGFFEKRKALLSEQNGQKPGPDYQELLSKRSVLPVKTKKSATPVTRDKPSELTPFVVILLTVLSMAFGIWKWLF